MHLVELERSLRQLRLGGMAAVLETRLRQAQAEPMAPIDLIACLVSDELTRRADRLLERRRKQAGFRDPDKTLDNFDFSFNPKMNRSLVFDLATGAFVAKREDALFLGPGGAGKSHLAQAIGQATILQGYKVLYREVHILLDELSDAVAEGTRKEYVSPWLQFLCSSSMTSACANCRTQPQRICWRSSCAAMSASAHC
jgi:DNA replication protein DnaC